MKPDVVGPIPDFLTRLEAVSVLGILRGCPPDRVALVAESAVRAGMRILEVSFDSDRPEQQIASVCSALSEVSDVIIGAGTIVSPVQVRAAVSAGASFIVCPVVAPEVIDECASLGIACLPGAASPTEVWRAIQLGASAVKVYPANHLGGPDYIRSLQGPLSGVRLVPTGGVTIANVVDYLEAGAAAVGVGSAVFSGDAMSGIRFDEEIAVNATAMMRTIRGAQSV